MFLSEDDYIDFCLQVERDIEAERVAAAEADARARAWETNRVRTAMLDTPWRSRTSTAGRSVSHEATERSL